MTLAGCGFNQDLGQADRVEDVVGGDAAYGLGQPVAVPVIFEAGSDAAGQAGQAVGRVVCKGAAAVTEQVAVVRSLDH